MVQLFRPVASLLGRLFFRGGSSGRKGEKDNGPGCEPGTTGAGNHNALPQVFPPWAALPKDVIAGVLQCDGVDTAQVATVRLTCRDWRQSVDATTPQLNLTVWPSTQLLAKFPACVSMTCVKACLRQPCPPQQAQQPAVHLIHQVVQTQPQLTSFSLALQVNSAPETLAHLTQLGRLRDVTVLALPSPDALASTPDQPAAAAGAAGEGQPLQPLQPVQQQQQQQNQPQQRLQLDALQGLSGLQSLQVINASPDYATLRPLTQVTRLSLLRQPMLRVVLDTSLDASCTGCGGDSGSGSSSPAGSPCSTVVAPTPVTARTPVAYSLPEPSAAETATTTEGSSSGVKIGGIEEITAVDTTNELLGSAVGEEAAGMSVGEGAGMNSGANAATSSNGSRDVVACTTSSNSTPRTSGSGQQQAPLPQPAAQQVQLGQRGMCLAGLGELRHLASLSVQRATHAWELPDAITQLTRLQDLDVSRNCLASLPADLGALAGLTRLELTNCCLPELPDSFSCLVSLRHLAAGGNPGLQLPLGATALTALTHLDLSWSDANNIGAVFQLSPDSFRSLEYLNLRGTSVTELPPSFGQLASLTELNLSANLLEHVPEAILSLSNLKDLNLSMNRLESLPEPLAPALSSSLTRLVVNMNRLAKLPRSLGKLRRLVHLDVSANQITCLPSSLSMLVRLEQLKVTANPLPAAALSKLQELRTVEVCA